MLKYHSGELLKKLRKQRGISQDELAGIYMDRAHISKIEGGKIQPNKATMEYLLEKLGFDPQPYLIYYLDNEMTDYQKYMDELDGHLAYNRIEEADKVMEELENNEKFMGNFVHRQYVICAKAANFINKRVYDFNLLMRMLVDALKITIPLFKEKDIESYLLARYEFRAINMMGIVYDDNGESEKAIDIMTALKNNFDKNCIDKTYRGKNYPTIINSLTRYLYNVGKYKEALELCENGERVTLDTGFLYDLPFIVMNKVMCLYKLGDMDSCERYIRQVYHSSDMYKKFDMKEFSKKYAQNKLGISL